MVNFRSVHYHTLLNDMSFCMQAEIAMAGTEIFLRKVKISYHLMLSTCISICKQVPLFQDIDTAFLRKLSLTLDKFFYLPNQFIVVTRDIDYDLYIIQEGNVSHLTTSYIHHYFLCKLTCHLFFLHFVALEILTLCACSYVCASCNYIGGYHMHYAT